MKVTHLSHPTYQQHYEYLRELKLIYSMEPRSCIKQEPWAQVAFAT